MISLFLFVRHFSCLLLPLLLAILYCSFTFHNKLFTRCLFSLSATQLRMGFAFLRYASHPIQESWHSIIQKICIRSLRDQIRASQIELQSHIPSSNLVIFKMFITTIIYLIYSCISYFSYREILCFKTDVQAIRCRFNCIFCSFLHGWLWLTDTIIGNIRKQYVDTRTQANLSKLNADRQKDLDIGTDELSLITERRRRLGKLVAQLLQFCFV